MNHRERMLAGLPYLANQDGLNESRMSAQELLYTYNNLPPQRWEEQRGLLEQLLGGIGENSTILPPLRCDYGKHIVVGRDVFTNYNLTILDVCPVTIGDRTLIGPNVSIYAAGHPIAPEDRDKLLKDYSHGMKNKMQMLVNIIAQPNILLLDEPLTSLDVVVAEEMKNLLRSLKDGRITIFSTHILDLALDLCDEIVLLSHGELEVVEKSNLDDHAFKEKIIAALKEESYA